MALYSEEALYTLSETDIFTQADISLNLYPDQNIIFISLGCVCNIYIYTVVAEIIRTLVFLPAKNGFNSFFFLYFAVVCQ